MSVTIAFSSSRARFPLSAVVKSNPNCGTTVSGVAVVVSHAICLHCARLFVCCCFFSSFFLFFCCFDCMVEPLVRADCEACRRHPRDRGDYRGGKNARKTAKGTEGETWWCLFCLARVVLSPRCVLLPAWFRLVHSPWHLISLSSFVIVAVTVTVIIAVIVIVTVVVVVIGFFFLFSFFHSSTQCDYCTTNPSLPLFGQ